MFQRQPSVERAARVAARAEARDVRRGRAKTRRHERATAFANVGRRLRPAAPIALVTGLAMYGQIGYAYDQVTPVAWLLPARLLLAVAVAVAVESMALTVQWHAHDALLHGHTLTAARHRRTSYLIAAGVGLINYSHFAGPGWTPTPAAVVFAGFSTSGPWLWGLHTRRAQRVQLSREGQPDTGGAVFRAERYRWFPIRTLMALRWSIDHGVTDPRQAWEGYNADRRKSTPGKAVPAASKDPRPGRLVPPTAPGGPSTSTPPDVAMEAVREPWRPRLVADLKQRHPASTSNLQDAPGGDQDDDQDGLEEKVRQIVAGGGGRTQVMRELEVSEYRARRLLQAVQPAGSSR